MITLVMRFSRFSLLLCRFLARQVGVRFGIAHHVTVRSFAGIGRLRGLRGPPARRFRTTAVRSRIPVPAEGPVWSCARATRWGRGARGNN